MIQLLQPRRIVRSLIAMLIITGSVAVAGQPPSAPIIVDPVLAEFSVHSDGDLLLVPVRIAGKEYSLALDTGAQVTVFDTSLQPLLGQPMSVNAKVNHELEVKVFRWLEGRLGGLKLSLPAGSPVLALDLQEVRNACGHEVFGLLGFDWLRSQIVQVDFSRGRLLVLRELPAQPGEAVPMGIVHGAPFARARLPGCGDVRLMLDTANDGSINLLPDQYSQLAQSKEFRPVGHLTSGVMTATGTKSADFGVAQFVQLGGNQHKSVLIHRSTGPSGLLGLGILSKYTVTFDFPNRTMYLSNPHRLDEPANWDQSGLGLIRREGRTIIAGVDPRGPAEGAGFIAGDEIVALEARKWGSFDCSRCVPFCARAVRHGQCAEEWPTS